MEGNSGPSKKWSNILWQILGNDTHNHNDGLNVHSQGMQRKIPSQFSIWLGALQHMRLSKALEGIHVSNNTGLLILFIGFGVWLFVVYTVRHNDPLAKHIEEASKKVLSPHRQLDEHLVSRMSAALPLKVYQDDVHLFVPGTNSEVGISEQQGLQINSVDPAANAQAPSDPYASTGPGAAVGAEAGPFADPRFGTPSGQQSNFGFTPNVIDAQANYPSSYQGGQVYNAPMPQPMPVFNAPPMSARGPVSFGPSADGSRLKMIVNR